MKMSKSEKKQMFALLERIAVALEANNIPEPIPYTETPEGCAALGKPVRYEDTPEGRASRHRS